MCMYYWLEVIQIKNVEIVHSEWSVLIANQKQLNFLFWYEIIIFLLQSCYKRFYNIKENEW